MNRETLLEWIKQSVHKVEPSAQIILYGSRSRGDATAESDWDLLILVNGKVDDERIDRIRYQLYEVEWETGEVLSSIIRNHREWGSVPYNMTPLHECIEREGILV